MNETQHALETSATHLRDLVGDLDAVQLATQAYPTKWTQTGLPRNLISPTLPRGRGRGCRR